MQNLRFDNHTDRIRSDKLAKIRVIWDQLMKKYRSLYTLTYQLTFDEQLVTFRGR